MSTLLIQREEIIAYLKHIGVIPSAWASYFRMISINPKVVLNRCPDTLDVHRGSPAVSGLWAPLNRLLISPVTNGIKYGMTCLVQGVSHCRISDSSRDILIEAIVILQVVHSPRGPCFGINFFVVKTASSTLASKISS